MILIRRQLARQLRAVFRRLVNRDTHRPMVSFHAELSVLRVRLHGTAIRAEYEHRGTFEQDQVLLPYEALAQCEAKKNDAVTLTQRDQHVAASWTDAGVPQLREYDLTGMKEMPAWPKLAKELASTEAGLLNALVDASASAGTDAVRFALQHLQLRGKEGTIVGTNGTQLLVQTGFTFPFTNDLLIPATKVYKELANETDVKIGASKSHVMLQAGPWTLHLPIDAKSRYPKAEEVIPSLKHATRCTLSTDDASFLMKSLPRLPKEDDGNDAVTMDLNGEVVVRARASAESKVTEVVLVGSKATGKPVRWNANRALIHRALDLGMTELAVVNKDSPIVCKDDRRTFVFMPLLNGAAIPPCDDAMRIVSDVAAASKEATPAESKAKTHDDEPAEPVSLLPMVRTNGDNDVDLGADNGHAGNGKSEIHVLLQEASALRNALRDAYTRSHALITGLQRYRKQSQAVKSTLASLRQLQQLADV